MKQMNRHDITEQINEAALIEAKKSFRVRGGSPDYEQGTENRVNRSKATYNFIRRRLCALDQAIARNDVALFADKRTLVYASLGIGIRDIIIIPEGTPDPDYPQNSGKMDASHGGILQSPRVEVVIDTPFAPETYMLTKSAELIQAEEGPNQLKLPLYTAINFVEDTGSINPGSLSPHALPYVDKDRLNAHGTLLTIGEPAVTAHHAAIAEAAVQIA